MSEIKIILIEASVSWRTSWEEELKSVGHNCVSLVPGDDIGGFLEDLPAAIVILGDLTTDREENERIINHLRCSSHATVISSSFSNDMNTERLRTRVAELALEKKAVPYFVCGMIFGRSQRILSGGKE